MKEIIKNIKGTKDILPNEVEIWQYVENKIHLFFQKYGYQQIRTPKFENTLLFNRSIGLDTDIVNKEMYSWTDQGGNNLTLKPEVTASVVRSFIQHNLGKINHMNKLYYIDSLFRRERPQKGRQRQFYQFGVEAIGSPYPEQDVEIISLAYGIYKNFGIEKMEVKINSIGSSEIRPTYLALLKKSLQEYIDDFCNSCKLRLQNNALRLFDCKNSQCQEILMEKAPYIFDSISSDDHAHFVDITRRLDEMDIPYVHDKSLVRGLDYYTHTTFEISSSSLGSQDALCGGGRYNDLIQQIGGKSTPAVGFAAGVERLILAIGGMKTLESSIDIYLITIGNEANAMASNIANELREKNDNIVILETLRRSMKSQMREANRCGAKHAIIIGEEELANGMVIIKDMKTSKQVELPSSDIIKFFNSKS